MERGDRSFGEDELSDEIRFISIDRRGFLFYLFSLGHGRHIRKATAGGDPRA